MTLEDLVIEANKLLSQGISPDTKVYFKSDQGETNRADCLSVWKVASLETWCSGDILDESDEQVVTLS